ncbi:MAG: helix-turn-helix transcriptional regulator [Paracoccaceae bacterium]
MTLMFGAALDPSHWTDFLDRLRQVSGGVRTHLFGHDQQSDHSVGLLSSGYEDSFVESYINYFGVMNPWAPSFSRHASGAVLPSEYMCPDAELVRTEFYHDWIRPQEDIRGGGGSVLVNENNRSFLFGGNIRQRDVDALSENWMELVAMLTPQLQHAININRALAGKSLERLASEGGRAAHSSVFAVSARGALLYANESAYQLLEAGDVIGVDLQNRVTFQDQAAASLFSSAVFSTGLPDRQHATQFRTADAGRRKTYLCRTARLGGRFMGHIRFAAIIGNDEPCLVLIMTPEQEAIDTVSLLARHFGATPGEAQIAVLLASGRRLAEIAEERAVSIHTVRNQLKSVMSKMNVRRQADLVRAVLRLAGGEG